MINPEKFRQWWDVFHADDPFIELRLVGTIDGRERILSGYFTDQQTAIDALSNYGEGVNVFSPFNKVKSACSNRAQINKLIQVKDTTSDNDIEYRRWLMIDCDPKRPKGTNSSAEEKESARLLMMQIGTFLRDQGFRSPVVTMSGNGYHLYYRVEMPNNEECKKLCQNFLIALDLLFSNDDCEIDRATFNAARVTKVVGSVAYKGRNTEERPCRMSEFIKIPEEVLITPVEVVQKVAAMIPQKEAPNRFNGYRDNFDIDSFISEHNIEVAYERVYDGGRKIVLAHCPFDPNHKAPDSAIFVGKDGAIGFKCLHNSCASYTWKDVRLLYDPNAYSRMDREQFSYKRDFYSQMPRPKPIPVKENEKQGKKWLNMSDIKWQDPNSETYIPTGMTELDRKMGGLCLGDVTILSGIAGAGKTSILNNLILSAIQHGYKVSIWSGELAPYRFKSWFNQAAAGSNFVRKGYKNQSEYWYCPNDISDKIDRWTQDKIFLYNNNYGNHSSQILQDIKDRVAENGTQLVCLDNKMAMMLDSYEGDKNEKDAGLINELKDYAMAAKIHIILVCHPRKENTNSLLRMESIAGNSDLYNAAANVLLAHVVGNDFVRRATEFFGSQRVQDITAKNYNEVVEIAKNRTHGAKDSVIGLYYEQQTRRFLNEVGEYVVYGWQDTPVSQQIHLQSSDFLTPSEEDGVPW